MGKTFTLELPDDAARSAQEIADRTGRPIEEVLIETLMMHLPPGGDLDAQLEALTDYTDTQLWAVVGHRLSPAQDNRRVELTQKSRSATLTESEDGELQSLLDLVDSYILLRSEAIGLLKSRGYEVSHFFNYSTK